MAGKTGTTPPDVAWLEALAVAPHAFGFFSVLRRLECLYGDRPRLGQTTRASDTPVRLAQQAGLDFAPATLTAFRAGSDEFPHRLEVAFLGLFGPNGPLPIHLTEYARERQRNFGDRTFLEFANIFHHRVLELFYRAWAAPRPTVSLDRPDADRFGDYLASLIGIGMPELRDRDALPDFAKLHYAGHLSCQSRHPDGLCDMVRDFFRLPARIVEIVGEWLELPVESRCRLGESTSTGTLGQTVVIGAQVWSRQHKFRLVLGPVGYPDYLRFLPIGGSLAGLVAMVRNYAGDQYSWDLNLVLRREEVPAARLGVLGHLGWTTWLHTARRTADADDLKLRASRYG
jgi:type VI secretion system protein ImpH